MPKAMAAVDGVSRIKIVTFAFLIMATLFLAGCNTTAGLGRDIESAGDAIEDTADDASD